MAGIDIDINKLALPEQAAPDAGEAVSSLVSVTEPDISSDRGGVIAGQTLVLNGTEREPTEQVVALADPDKEGSLNNAVANKQLEVIQNARKSLQSVLEVNPDGFAAQVESEQKRVENVDESTALERAVTEAIANNAPIKVDDLVKDEETFLLAAANDLARIAEAQGLGGKSLDFFGFFMPFNLTADLSDVLDTEFPFSDADNIGGFILDFQALPTERKRKEWPFVLDSIMRATGTTIPVIGLEVSDKNTLKALGVLINLLSPEGAATQSAERTLDILLGAADIVGTSTITGLLSAGIKTMKASTNMIKRTDALGDTGRAADMDIMAVNSEDAAKTMGIAQQEAATNALPIEQQGWRPEFTAGLAPEISRKINEFQRQAEGLTRSFRDETALVKEGLLRDIEKAPVVQSRFDALKGDKSDVLSEGAHVDNIRVTSADETGFVIEYDMLTQATKLNSRQTEKLRREVLDLDRAIEGARGADKKALKAAQDIVRAQLKQSKASKKKVQENVRWELDEATGSYIETVRNAIVGFEYGVSPAAWSHTGKGASTDFMGAFKSASNLADLAAATQSKMLALVTESNKTISGVLGFKARKRLDDVEIYGDEFIDPATGIRGKVFTPDELRRGIDTPNGTVKLTSPAEIEAYYKHRIVADQFWQLENHSARRRLEILGFVEEVGVAGERAIAKPFESAGAAKSSVSKETGTHMWDETKQEMVEFTDDVIDAAYLRGDKVVRLSKDTQIKNIDGSSEATRYAVVSKTDSAGLPAKVLHYKQGYVPKINLGVEFLVKERIPAVMRGVEGYRRQVTHRFFSSRKDAEAYKADQAAAYRDANPNASDDIVEARFEVKADREQTPMERIHEDAGSSGGLYNGPRSSSNIHSGIDGVLTERLSPFMAFQRNAQHIGSLVARSEWRLGEERRWLNTLDELGLKSDEGFSGTVLDLRTKEGRALDVMRNHILRWNQVPTNEERMFSSIMQDLHDWALTGVRKVPGLSDKAAIKSLLYLKHSDPASAMKAVAFNLALGVMNPAQLFVQASAAVVGISRFPRIAGQTIPYALKLGWTDGMKNSKAINRIGNKLDDADTPIFTELREGWERSGLRESVRQNADLNSADSYGAMTLGALKRLSDANLVLYRSGEMFNRRMSFTASFLEWRRVNPKAKLTNDVLKKIKADANLSMLELGHANRAMWQGGPDSNTLAKILGMMTQFQQVGAKGIELIAKGELRGGFSTAEKGRILLAQTLLYGAAGVPLANAIVGAALDHFGINMSKEEREVINQGVAGALVVNTFGAEVQVATRLAPFGQLPNLIRDIVFDEVPLAEAAFGVFGDMYGRAGIAIDRLQPMIVAGIEGQPTTKGQFLMGLQAVAEIPSGPRNWVKATIMHNQHKILDRHGNTVVGPRDLPVGGFNWQTEVAQMLGFKTIIESETRIMQMSNKDYTDADSETADAVVWLFSNYVKSGETDPLAGQQLKAALQVIFETVDNPLRKKRIMSIASNRINSGSSVREREVKKFFDRTIPSEIDAGAKALRRNFFANTIQERPVVQPLSTEE